MNLTFGAKREQGGWTEEKKEKMKKGNNELLNSVSQSEKATEWESPNQCRQSAEALNDGSNKECDCESLVMKLKKTVSDRMRDDTARNKQHSNEYNKSIQDLTTDMTMSREEMKSVKSSLLSLFDSNEKLKQSNRIVRKENEELAQDLESTNDEVNSLMNKLKKMNKENEAFGRDVIREGAELEELKQRERQTAQDNDEMIQLKRILTTSIVLARKEIGRLMNDVHGLVSKRATVRQELDVLIKTYDY